MANSSRVLFPNTNHWSKQNPLLWPRLHLSPPEKLTLHKHAFCWKNCYLFACNQRNPTPITPISTGNLADVTWAPIHTWPQQTGSAGWTGDGQIQCEQPCLEPRSHTSASAIIPIRVSDNSGTEDRSLTIHWENYHRMRVSQDRRQGWYAAFSCILKHNFLWNIT